MKKIFSVLLLGTALTFSTACKKDEKKDADKADKGDKGDKGAKGADDKGGGDKAATDDKGAAAGDSVGAAECDELIKRTRCSYDKAGAAMPAEAKKAFDDSVGMWKDALKNDATKQATIDACKMSLDAAKDGFAAQGC